jgi:hypothetical protein
VCAGFVARATVKMLSKRETRSGRNFFMLRATSQEAQRLSISE